MTTTPRPAWRKPPGPPSDPDEAAVYWWTRRQLGLMTPQDDAVFRRWLDDPVNGMAFEAVSTPMEALGDVAAAPEVRQMREAALSHAPLSQAPVKRRRLMIWIAGVGSAIAAALAAAALLSVTLSVDHRPGIGTPIYAPVGGRPVETTHYASGVGERMDVTLDDGSVVKLNTGSLVEVAYTAARRDIRLLRGQAIFEVAHNPRRPFVVTAGARRITATGTAFDVRLDGETVRVVLIEGHVAVTPVTRTGLQRIVPALGSQDLSAGEALTAPPDGPVRVAATDVDRITSWRRGQVVFRDDPLSAAVAEMNRYSDDKLVIDDPRVAALTISGAFGATRSENFRAALTAYYPVEIQKRS